MSLPNTEAVDEMVHSPPPSVVSTLESLLLQSPNGMRLPNMDAPEAPSCCCGRSQCAYLEHNNAALEGLEKDLRSAAQIGQVSSRTPNPHLTAICQFGF